MIFLSVGCIFGCCKSVKTYSDDTNQNNHYENDPVAVDFDKNLNISVGGDDKVEEEDYNTSPSIAKFTPVRFYCSWVFIVMSKRFYHGQNNRI